MKKVDDQEFIEAYLSSPTRAEVARKLKLTPESVTDRAADMRKRLKINLPKFPKPQKTQPRAARQAAKRLLAAVGDDPEFAVTLLDEEVSDGICTKTLALLWLTKSLDEALELVRGK